MVKNLPTYEEKPCEEISKRMGHPLNCYWTTHPLKDAGEFGLSTHNDEIKSHLFQWYIYIV